MKEAEVVRTKALNSNEALAREWVNILEPEAMSMRRSFMIMDAYMPDMKTNIGEGSNAE